MNDAADRTPAVVNRSDDAVERGALALRLGIWDETVMPWDNEASRAQVGETMRMLRAREAAIVRELDRLMDAEFPQLVAA